MFNWETGLGLTADQVASVAYKRRKAAEFAQRIGAYARQQPKTPTAVIGFSAGAAVAVFALEALPPEIMVDDVVLLSGSLSANYDLTLALAHVRGRMYVFTSHRDAMLQFLMVLTGTADRVPTAHGSIGADGVRVPQDASPEARRQYAKVMMVPWNESFTRLGDRGGHFDAVNAKFIQAVVAPLLMSDARTVAAPAVSGFVPNPDYERWVGFAVGSWVEMRGYQVINGTRTPLALRQTLVANDAHRLVVEREFIAEGPAVVPIPLSRRFVVPAQIDPREHPGTAPQHVQTELPPLTITVGGHALTCRGFRLQAQGAFAEWGTDVDARIYAHDAIPCGVARLAVSTVLNGKPAEFSGEVVTFHAVPRDRGSQR